MSLSSPTDESRENQAVEELISAGSDMVGGISSVALGFLIAGHEGAYTGALTAPVVAYTLRRIAVELKQRVLARREEVRIGAALEVAATQFGENLDAGKQVRQDNFFDADAGERSAAEEVTEGVLLAAQREYEERKVPFEGRLLANLMFHPEIDRAHANYLIRLAQSLSYRQLCLLVLFMRKRSYPLRQGDWRTMGVKNSLSHHSSERSWTSRSEVWCGCQGMRSWE